MSRWEWWRFIVRAENILHPIARLVAIVLVLSAFWQVFNGNYLRAMAMNGVALIIHLILRWDPPLIEIREEEIND